MKVILFKLDNPSNKYEWFFKDVEIKVLEDFEKVMGYCAIHIYAELYQVDEDDDLGLVKKVRECLSSLYPETARDIIMWLFEVIKKMAETRNE